MSDKIKETLQFAIVEPRAATVPQPVEKKGWGAAKYVQFGEDNKYPDFLLECYENCAVLQSIINRLADYVAGSGVDDEQQGEREVNTDGLTLNDLVKKCAVALRLSNPTTFESCNTLREPRDSPKALCLRTVTL